MDEEFLNSEVMRSYVIYDPASDGVDWDTERDMTANEVRYCNSQLAKENEQKRWIRSCFAEE